jgi:GNAT superfamily N-acetyltransferase
MIADYTLTNSHRLQLARAFRNVPRVDIAIDCVLEDQMGKACVDNPDSPSAFEIRVGPFHYFAGDALSDGGQKMLENLQPYNLFMPSSEGWLAAGKGMYGERLVCVDRYSFSSEQLSLEHVQKLIRDLEVARDVKRFDAILLDRTWEREHFIDISDFDSPADFLERGIGYYLERDGEPIGAAYSSLVCSTAIEVSIFIAGTYRRQSIATVLAAHLLQWCLQNNMGAHWDAANPESCRLAVKLGYRVIGSYQAHYLSS